TPLPPPVLAKGPAAKPGTQTTDTRPAAAKPAAQTVDARPTPTKPAPGAGDANKLRAAHLVGEAQRLVREGKVLEARQKAVEAQRLGATFGPDEVSPEMVYQQVALQVRRDVEGLMREAHDLASYGAGEPTARCAQAEAKLQQARQLAASFGQDTQPVEQKMAWLRQLQSGSPAPRSDEGVAQASHTPGSKGEDLLAKARLELKRGETAIARRLAEDAYRGQYGVEEKALGVLRSIDAEEENQKRLQAIRAFDAAMAAYRRREFAHASTMMAAVDAGRLDPARQARIR